MAGICDDPAGVAGQIFELVGGRIHVCLGWNDDPEFDHGKRWDAAELGKKTSLPHSGETSTVGSGGTRRRGSSPCPSDVPAVVRNLDRLGRLPRGQNREESV